MLSTRRRASSAFSGSFGLKSKRGSRFLRFSRRVPETPSCANPRPSFSNDPLQNSEVRDRAICSRPEGERLPPSQVLLVSRASGEADSCVSRGVCQRRPLARIHALHSRLLTDLHQIITRLDVMLVWLGVAPCRV